MISNNLALFAGDRLVNSAITCAALLNFIKHILSSCDNDVIIVFIVCLTKSNLENPSSSSFSDTLSLQPSPIEPELSIIANNIIGLRSRGTAVLVSTSTAVSEKDPLFRNSSINVFKPRLGTRLPGYKGRRVIGDI